uniref:(northern house mosquito) hypothetical protein n=1 Tax=Culex pipiens TaxID=7175 RepID=A0A8D8N0Q9_CULPI
MGSVTRPRVWQPETQKLWRQGHGIQPEGAHTQLDGLRAALRSARLDRRPVRQGCAIHYRLLRRWHGGRKVQICPTRREARHGFARKRLGPNEGRLHALEV